MATRSASLLPRLVLLALIGGRSLTSSAPNERATGTSVEKGVIYVQPSYHYMNTLRLDLDVLKHDLDRIAQNNFTNIGLRTNWGELMSRWDPVAKQPTWNTSACDALAAIAAETQQRGLKLIFNTQFGSVPQGIDGAEYVPLGPPDSNGVRSSAGGYWRSPYRDKIARDAYKEPMVLFHRKFAECLRASPLSPHYWKHSFESVYLFPNELTPAEAANETVAAGKFGRWAQDTHPSIEHWAQRWGEPELHSFGEITLPDQTTYREQPHGKAKFGDWWRFWLIGVLKTGRYGLSIADIYGGLQEGAGGAFEPMVAFKHWKPNNFIGLTDLTPEEIKEIYDLPINATALGYYVMTPEALAKEPAQFNAYVDEVRAVAPPHLPLIDWETGASTFNLTESQQAEWATKMYAGAVTGGLGGFNWWQWIDWAPVPGRPCNPLRIPALAQPERAIARAGGAVGEGDQCLQLHFGAHYANGTAKEVWHVLGQL